MFFGCKNIYLLLLVVLLGSSQRAKSQNPESPNVGESARSLLELIEFNNASIRQADVLVSYQETIDHLDGVRIVTTDSRLMFDLDKEKIVQFSVATGEEATGAANTEQYAMRATLIKEGTVLVNRWPEFTGRESYKRQNFTQACVEFGCVPFGMIGLQHYLHPAAPRTSQNSQSYEEYCEFMWTMFKSKASAKSEAQLSLGPIPVGTTGTSRFVDLKLDGETKFPAVRTNWVIIDGKKFLNSKESMDWQVAKSGHVLPKSTFLEEFVATKSKTGKKTGTRAINIKFQWLSVNKPIADEFFDAKTIADGLKVRNLTELPDPQAKPLMAK